MFFFENNLRIELNNKSSTYKIIIIIYLIRKS